MNDFDYDVRCKKQIARSAPHRVRSPKSSRCPLPSDHLTAAQWRRMNGPVVSVNLNVPITYDEFKALPDHLRREYVLSLLSHGAGVSDMAEMFGVSRNTMSTLIATKIPGVAKTLKPGRKSKQARKAWSEFLSGKTAAAVAAFDALTTPVPEQEPADDEKTTATVLSRSAQIVFSAVPITEDVVNLYRSIVPEGEESDYEVVVVVRKRKE